MARKQLYGGKEADERRNPREVFEERLLDNQVAEGDVVDKLNWLVKCFISEPTLSRKQAVDDYCAELLSKGFSKSRLDSIVSRASFNIKLPKRTQYS